MSVEINAGEMIRFILQIAGLAGAAIIGAALFTEMTLYLAFGDTPHNVLTVPFGASILVTAVSFYVLGRVLGDIPPKDKNGGKDLLEFNRGEKEA